MSRQSAPLWTTQDIISATGGMGMTEGYAKGVSIDSRTVMPQDLFVAIRGSSLDGHDYVGHALDAGASIAIIDSDVQDVDTTKLLRVFDTQRALEDLGCFARNRINGKVIAVTGSVGKTSVKQGLYEALSRCDITHASWASYNNQWGVPLSLARMPAETKFGIFEIGMNHADEIGLLVKQVRPDSVVITKITFAHIENFDSIQEIAMAKAEIFSGIEGENIAIIPADSEWYDFFRKKAQEAHVAFIVSFGESQHADIRVLSCQYYEDYSDVDVNILGEYLTCRIGIAGRHAVMNSMAILAVVRLIGGNLDHAVSSLRIMESLEGRGRRYQIQHDNKEFTLIDETYNANPESMCVALNILGQCKTRRIAVLGDMNELGIRSDELHIGLVKVIISSGIDIVLTIGNHMRHVHDSLPISCRRKHVSDLKILKEALDGLLCEGDTVMIKASNEMGLSRLVNDFLHENVDEKYT